MPKRIDRAKYEELRGIWTDLGGTNVDRASKRAKIRPETAKRYIYEGDESRGWEAIHDWYKRAMARADVVAEKSFSELAAENVQQYGLLKDGVFNELTARMFRLCRTCRMAIATCDCSEEDADHPDPYEATVQDFTRLGMGQFRWAGGGVFEQQALTSFMGVVMMEMMSALREAGIPEEDIEDQMRRIGAQFKLMASKGVKQVGSGK